MLIDDFQHFNILSVYKRGVCMHHNGVTQPFPKPEVAPYLQDAAHNTFHVPCLTPGDFAHSDPLAVIGMVPGQIVTENMGFASCPDPQRDILKIAVIERHKNTRHIGLGYLQGYGLKTGAVATSISHDSHNIIVIGASDEDMAFAVNQIIENEGGIVVVENGQVSGKLILSIGGIMSEDTLEHVNRDLEQAKSCAFRLGVHAGIDPFMTLSFMALPVIPTLRLTTRGVIDVLTQTYV